MSITLRKNYNMVGCPNGKTLHQHVEADNKFSQHMQYQPSRSRSEKTKLREVVLSDDDLTPRKTAEQNDRQETRKRSMQVKVAERRLL